MTTTVWAVLAFCSVAIGAAGITLSVKARNGGRQRHALEIGGGVLVIAGLLGVGVLLTSGF